MKSMLLAVAAAVATAAGVALAAPAHADDASYLDALHRSGINWLPWMQGSEISSGHIMCSELRSGSRPADLVGQFPIPGDAGPSQPPAAAPRPASVLLPGR
jgi:hypothetical protein